ncbi:conserved Plasmodium protein, unknown function [Plasmodium reichenowi]|uniref:Histone RNA hairpin-binding protein RNA-binding domain-containing protein n=1 Tax=Plasmodium reichenowi TaxID=5854 RepID=A0A060RXW2_PLARE|nr:conserved Plasmodium protein, unknown function [Plasmodium reichenowi]
MSTIRWVDLLSSESNFSHSKTNNDDVNEKLKKKKVFFKSEADLNNSFLNSYNGDLDNSNVGINLKIKNMCIKEKKDIKADEKINEKICSNKKDTIIQKNVNTNYDEKINVVHNIPYNDKDKKEKEEGLLNKIDNFDDNTNDQSKLYINNVQVSETQKNISPLDEKENNNNNNNNKIVEKKTSKQTDDNKTNQDDVKVKVKINLAYPEQNNNDDLENEKDNKNKERVINNIPTHKEEQNNDISVISSNEESNPNNNNSKYILRNDKDTCNNTEDMSNRNKEKTTTQNILKNPVSNKNKEENCQSRDSSKKRNSVSKSSKNIIHPVDDNKKNVESLINPSETKKNDSLKMNQEKNIKYMEHSKKGKNKRKERNNNMENSMINNNSISVLDYTVSHDVTLDENNIPLNPTKKMKNKMKDLKHLEDDKNDDILNMNKSKIPNSFKQADSNNIVIKKLMKEENNSSVKENETINFLKIQNMNTMIDKEDNPFYNVMNNNIDLEKFKNFNNNFINYIGDIRNNFSESLCTANRNRVNSRLKEIAVGKSTKEYKNYVKLVKYQDRLEDDPATPNAYEDITNAKFQAKYNLWRKKLHKFDTLN